MTEDEVAKSLSIIIGAWTGEALGYELSQNATASKVEDDVKWMLKQLVGMPNPGLQRALDKICS